MTKDFREQLEAMQRAVKAAVRQSDASMRRLLASAEQAREAAIKTDQRMITWARLDQCIWDIWSHCRENRDSPDSERHCRIIRETIDAAVAEVQQRVESLAAAHDKLQGEHKALRREHKSLIAENAKMGEKCQSLELSVKRLKGQLKKQKEEKCVTQLTNQPPKKSEKPAKKSEPAGQR